MGYLLNEYGLFRGDVAEECATEADIYHKLGLNYVPPELREAIGEIDEAESSGFDDLLERKSIKGTFHVHSTWSDGTAPIEAMARKAQEMGLSYMGLSDHSKSAAYANGLNEERLGKQIAEIDHLNDTFRRFRILKGMECDILPDGSLDLSDEMLSRLDFVIGSVHARFDMSEAEMTGRVCKALDNKYLTMLGHPTGRLILDRVGFKIDLERVIDVAARTGKVIELNANPHRLDLDATHVRRAREQGVKTSINPDAHSPKGLEDIEFGVHTARRGGLREKDVLNCMTLSGVLKYLGRN
jgi:DNA polymerase (family 10)